MSKRLWLYLITAIILTAMFTLGTAEKNAIRDEIARQQEESSQAQREWMENYLAKQTDSHKLVSLMKRLPPETDSRLLKMIALRANQLNPTNEEIERLTKTVRD